LSSPSINTARALRLLSLAFEVKALLRAPTP
jgi:hypothetical protein